MDAGEVTDAYKVYRRRLSDGSDAERQRRWRERRNALARSHPDVTERALLQQAERAVLGPGADGFGRQACGCGDGSFAAVAGACAAGDEGSGGGGWLTIEIDGYCAQLWRHKNGQLRTTIFAQFQLSTAEYN